MLKSTQISRLLTLALTLLVVAGIATAMEQSQSQSEPSRVQNAKAAVNPADLPQAVRQALQEAAPNDTWDSIEKVTRDGKVGYMVMMTGARGKHVVVVSEDGKIIKSDLKPETPTEATRIEKIKETVNPADLPQAVRQALQNSAPDENPVSAEKVTRDGKVGYMVVTAGARGKHVIVVSEDGKVLKDDRRPADVSPGTRVQNAKDAVDPANLPPAVRRALSEAAPNETIESAQKVNRDGRVGYMVITTGVRGKHVIVVSEDGKVLKNDVKLEGQSLDRQAEKKVDMTGAKSEQKIEKTKDQAQRRAKEKDAGRNPDDNKKKP